MTPQMKTKLKDGAEIRSMDMLVSRAEEGAENNYIVEGYAAKYEPYVLYKDNDGDVYERFSRANFDEADKSDIIFQYDHSGKVYARNTNGTLEVKTDDIGLHIKADLSKTESARQMYEEIQAGMVTKMSWRFTVNPDDYVWDKKARTLSYKRIQKIWDVSAVSIPANPNTSIASARSFIDGEIEKEIARIDAEQKLNERKKNLLNKLGG